MENSELLERFLPGYRIVCRIFARYLGIDLTDFMSKAFALFALFKSVQYLYAFLSGISSGLLTARIEVPEGDVQRDVLAWVERRHRVRGGRNEMVVAMGPVASSRREVVETLRPPSAAFTLPAYEPAFDSTMYFLQGYHLIALRRERRKPGAGGDIIILTCIGLTTHPLRDFLRECVASAARYSQVRTTGNGELLPNSEELEPNGKI